MHAKIENNQVTEFPIMDIRQHLPNISLPADLTENLPDGYVYVYPSDVPAYNPKTHDVRQVDPVFNEGKWSVCWDVFALDAATISSVRLSDIAAVTAAIKAERDRRIQTGGFKVGDKWYHSDTFSRTQQMGLVMLGSSIPAGTKWKTMDGSFVDMTQELAQQIFTTAAASDIAIFAAAELHIAAMQASENPSAYDFSSGWPEIFELP